MINSLRQLRLSEAAPELSALPNWEEFRKFTDEIRGDFTAIARLVFGESGDEVIESPSSATMEWLFAPWSIRLRQLNEISGVAHECETHFTICPASGVIQWYCVEDMNCSPWQMEGVFEGDHRQLHMEGSYPHAFLGKRVLCRVFYRLPKSTLLQYQFLMPGEDGAYQEVVTLVANKVAVTDQSGSV